MTMTPHPQPQDSTIPAPPPIPPGCDPVQFRRYMVEGTLEVVAERLADLLAALDLEGQDDPWLLARLRSKLTRAQGALDDAAEARAAYQAEQADAARVAWADPPMFWDRVSEEA